MENIYSGVQTLEWDDRALFGLVHGGHKWRLTSTGKKRLFGLVGRPQTQVTLDHEVTGGAPCGAKERDYESYVVCVRAGVPNTAWSLQVRAKTGNKMLGCGLMLLLSLLLLRSGFGQLLVSEKGMAKHGAAWLLELKDAVEGSR